MDRFSKNVLKELAQMHLQQSGRVVRSMSIARMIPAGGSGWQPAVDIYEAEGAFLLYAEIAGATAETLEVAVDATSIHIRGLRQLADPPDIARVHQLEMELGPFARSLPLPGPVDLDAVRSTYKNGMLKVVLPKRRQNIKTTILIQSGD
ncbi:Hsp20/alpha crystallin family protein [Desulfobulbus oralis]|uniref:Heat-shock protein Hsp20 n=1 Tax=Desulfobulbus oralis TaxID=1986146 RepID=A0A2L1GPY0_9BACT|nr:Hsp20/alpha crystallin family protein [Desulfobulbus oralis]AVD71733.1 heat-shock protein Hsp20 [Desulfobulbus oralis]